VLKRWRIKPSQIRPMVWAECKKWATGPINITEMRAPRSGVRCPSRLENMRTRSETFEKDPDFHERCCLSTSGNRRVRCCVTSRVVPKFVRYPSISTDNLLARPNLLSNDAWFVLDLIAFLDPISLAR
jgi:hypothetical protein